MAKAITTIHTPNRKMKALHYRVLLLLLRVLLPLLLLQGCIDEEPPLPDILTESQPKLNSSAQGAKDKDEEPEEDISIPTTFDYTYNPVGKRDPFEPYDYTKESNGNDLIVSPLQKYELSQITLKAVIWGVSKPKAVVITPDNQSYIVKVGDLMGKNWGRISRITKETLIVAEEFRDNLGKLIVEEVLLRLRNDK